MLGLRQSDAMQEAARKAREILDARRVKAKTAAASGPGEGVPPNAMVPLAVAKSAMAKVTLLMPPPPKNSEPKLAENAWPIALCKQPLLPKLPAETPAPPPLALALPKSVPLAPPPANACPKPAAEVAAPVPAAGLASGAPPAACKSVLKAVPEQFLVPGSASSDISDAPLKKAKASQPIKDKDEHAKINNAVDKIAIVGDGAP